jgi:tetratricopeptide (TPR) repeat protein
MLTFKRLQPARLRRWTALAALTLAGLLAQQGQPPKPPSAARNAYQNAEKAWRKKQMAQARSGYETALAIYPDYGAAWCALGAMQAQDGEFAAARRSFHQAIRSDPKAICPYLPLAMLEHEARDWSALLEVTDRLLRLDSIDYPIAHLLKAAAHYNLGEYAEAEKAAREAQALDSRNFPKIWEVLGWASVKRGNDVTAMAQFEKYLESAPLDANTAIVRAALTRLAARHPEIPKEEWASPTFRVEANLAQVQFQVTPKRGQLLQALQPEDVEIREDGVPQVTRLFEVGRSYQTGVPVEIWLLFDCSGSMISIGALDPYVFHTGLLDEYENVSIAMAGFSEDWVRFTKPTRDARTLNKAMQAVLAMPHQGTRLYRAIRETVLDAAEGRPGAIRMVVIFSDGGSSPVDDPPELALRAAQEHGVALYPIAVGSGGGPRFAKLGPETGGQGFLRPASDFVIPYLLKFLAKDVIQYTYVAGYSPDSSDKGTPHEAQVVLLNESIGQLSGGKRIVVH